MTEQERLVKFCHELDTIFDTAKKLPQGEYTLFAAPDATPQVQYRGLMATIYSPFIVKHHMLMRVAVALTRSLLEGLAAVGVPEGLQPEVHEEIDLTLSCIDSAYILKKLVDKNEDPS